LKSKTALRFGYEQAKIHQDFQTISTVVGYAFGGKKTEEPDTTPANIDQARSQLANVFRK
jgi:hypothetical protein